MLAFLMGKLFKKIFFGQLRAAEMEVRSPWCVCVCGQDIPHHLLLIRAKAWVCHSDTRLVDYSACRTYDNACNASRAEALAPDGKFLVNVEMCLETTSSIASSHTHAQ